MVSVTSEHVCCLQAVPSHQTVHKEAETLLLFLQLPAFPPVSRQSLLHPSLLSLRYLMDANLPGNNSANVNNAADTTIGRLTVVLMLTMLVMPLSLNQTWIKLKHRVGLSSLFPR